MTEFVCFGAPSRFEIAMRWISDREPRERCPAHGGWSMGEVRLTVGNHILTRHGFCGADRDAVQWYLLPLFEWLATNWVSLLHEERFAWRENRAVPAATAVFMALRRLIDAQSTLEQAEYAKVQGWWARHALRAADSSALYPDVVFRRLVDDIEISWTARQPSYAPDGYRFMLAPGAAILPVSEVAGPLWEALAWIVSAPPANLDVNDRRSIGELEQSIAQIKDIPLSIFEKAYLSENIVNKLDGARSLIDLSDSSIRPISIPAVTQFDDAVLMFGGVRPDIGAQDTRELLEFLSSRKSGEDSPELAELVDMSIGAPLIAPFEEGYELAEALLEQLGLDGGAAVIDVRALVSRLGVEVIEKYLKTSTIRGVAVAGAEYRPSIIVNLTSAYNAEERGRRFTLAHELFHVLYDRKRARRITHSSGPWAPPSIEKRANAFAAMMLMPRHLVRNLLPLGDVDREILFETAAKMEVGASSLLEHLYNTDEIDEFKRDELRAALERNA